MYSNFFPLVPLSLLCDLMNGYAFKPEDWSAFGLPIIRIQNLNGSKEFNSYRKVPLDRYLVEPNTLLFSWSGNRGTSFGPYIWSGPRGLLNQHIFKVTPRGNVDPNWLYFALDIARDEAEKYAHGGSGLVHVRRSELLSYRIPTPFAIEEQSAIASFLDRISKTILKTEALITKFKAIKQGLLQGLLTRGLDHNGHLRDPKKHPEQFKDSPLGQIPRSWEIVPLAGVSISITSGSRGWAVYYADQGALFLRMSNLTREHIYMRFDDLQYVDLPPDATEGRRTSVKPGDLLISITADLGIIGVCPEGLGEAYVNQHIALVKLKMGEVDARWVGNYLASGPSQKQFYLLNDQGAKAGMSLPSVERLLIAKPKKPEQERIAETLFAFDKRIESERVYYAKLRNIKKGLMQDLLTGRVRSTSEAKVTHA